MTRVAKERVAVGADDVFVYRVLPAPAPAEGPGARGARIDQDDAVLVPPLIGGGGLQQYRYFKELVQAGYELVSFDYRGHGRSGGRFCVRDTIEDACAVLAWYAARHPGRRVHGVADCYGAIPLLRAARRYPRALSSLVLFNPMPGLRHLARPREVLGGWFLPRGGPRCRSPVDLRGMVLATSARLFPDVDQSRDHFGILDYDRARPWRALGEYLFGRPLARTELRGVPALVVYGRSDAVLRLDDPASETAYRRAFARVLPEARFQPLEGVDHYWTDAYRRANEAALTFLATLEGRGPRHARRDEPGSPAEPRPARAAVREPVKESSTTPSTIRARPAGVGSPPNPVVRDASSPRLAGTHPAGTGSRAGFLHRL